MPRVPQLDVWLEDETIWLTPKQMEQLFGCASHNITSRIIFARYAELESRRCLQLVKNFYKFELKVGGA